MATRMEWGKGGLRLVAETSKRPMPRLRHAFPIPTIGTEQSAHIQAALEFQAATGRYGIRVTTISAEGLPGCFDDGGAWELQHTAYVGTAPAVLNWESISLGYVQTVNHLVSDPLPNATHRFRMVRQGVPGPPGRNVPAITYPECTSLQTPDDRGLGTGVVMHQHLGNPNLDNLIPNPTSEMGAGAPVGSWEAVLLVNDITNAYAGSWCRKLDASATNQTALCAKTPCIYGDQFSFDCWVKGSNGTVAAQLVLKFFDASGAVVGTTTSAAFASATYQSAAPFRGAAPATAVSVQAFVQASTTGAGQFLYFDNLSLRRSVKFDHLETDSGFRTKNALKNLLGTGTASDRAFYAGNCDPATRGGAPNISCLTVKPTVWNTTNGDLWSDFTLQPSASGVTDNLDGLRYFKIQVYRQSAAGTTATLTAAGPVFYLPVTDRLFANTTETNAANAVLTTLMARHTAFSTGVPAMLVTLYNAFGPSDTHCFYAPAGWSAGTALTDNGTSWPAGITGGGSGGSGGGGGGGGGCPAPWVLVDVLRGGAEVQVPAGELVLGDLLVTYHAATGTRGAWPIKALARLEDQERWDLTLEDGLVLTTTVHHRFYLADGRQVAIEDLQPGDLLAGDVQRLVAAVSPRDQGQVVAISADLAFSYQTSGVLQSNIKP